MHNDTRNEMQLRVLSGLHRYPELMETTPVYLAGDEPWLTIRRALEAFHQGRVDLEGLLRGMLEKYGWLYFEELTRVLENAEAVPSKRWAENQIQFFKEAIERSYAQENSNAA